MSSAPRTSYDIDGYCLGRSFSSSTRLNLQHYLWKDAVGYNIHPDIPVQNSKDFKIADVGTGTGIWLIDLNRQLPLSCFDGFDVSADQYPPKEWLPANLSLETLDIHKEIPEELKGKYDIVHVRLFLTVVKNDDPLPILKNLMDMLKPGGYLQWSEHNLATITVKSIKPGLKTSSIQYLVEHARNAVTYGWPPKLGDLFAEQGFRDVSYNRYPLTSEVRDFFTQMQFMVGEEYSLVAMDNSGPQTSGPAHRRRIQDAAEEAKAGAAMHFIPEFTVGRKPT